MAQHSASCLSSVNTNMAALTVFPSTMLLQHTARNIANCMHMAAHCSHICTYDGMKHAKSHLCR